MVTVGYGHLFRMIEDEKTRRLAVYAVLAMYLLYWLYAMRADGGRFQWSFAKG